MNDKSFLFMTVSYNCVCDFFNFQNDY